MKKIKGNSGSSRGNETKKSIPTKRKCDGFSVSRNRNFNSLSVNNNSRKEKRNQRRKSISHFPSQRIFKKLNNIFHSSIDSPHQTDESLTRRKKKIKRPSVHFFFLFLPFDLHRFDMHFYSYFVCVEAFVLAVSLYPEKFKCNKLNIIGYIIADYYFARKHFLYFF